MTKYYLNINKENQLILSGGNLTGPTTDLAVINRFLGNIAKYAETKEYLRETEETVDYLIDDVEISVNKQVLEVFKSYLAAYRILTILPKTVTAAKEKAPLKNEELEMIDIISDDLKKALKTGNINKIKELTTALKKKNHQLITEYNITIKVDRRKSISGKLITTGIILVIVGLVTVVVADIIEHNQKNNKGEVIVKTPSPYVSIMPSPTPSPTVDDIIKIPEDLKPYYDGNEDYNPYEYVKPTPEPYDPSTNENVTPTPEPTPAPTEPPTEIVTPPPYVPPVIDGGISYITLPGLQDESWTDKYAFVRDNYSSTFEKYAAITGNSSSVMMALATEEKGYHDASANANGDIGICQINSNIWLQKDSQGNYYISEDYYDFTENRWKNFLFDESIYNEEENILAGNIIFHKYLSEFKGNLVAALYAYNWGSTATREKITSIASEYNMDYDTFLTNTPDYKWIDAFNEEVIGEDGTTLTSNYALSVLRYLPSDIPVTCNIVGDDGNIYTKVYSVAPALTKDSEGFVFN